MAEREFAPPPELLTGAALFLDFDGTLVELADTPDAICVSVELVPLIQSLSRRLAGRIAIVSGRAVADLDRHIRVAGLAMAGSHGLELRPAGGRLRVVHRPNGMDEASACVAEFARTSSGLLVEEKPAGIAIHFRAAPHREEEVRSFVAALGARTGLAIQHGKMVAELRASGPGKGGALRILMAEPPFAGARPVFVGDDLTDEDAFEAAEDMGGAGILVGPERPTAASWRLPDVAAVAEWLGAAAGGKA